MHSKRIEWIGQLPSFSDLESCDADVNISVMPSAVTLITMVIEIAKNEVLHSQIVAELWAFTERYKNNSNLLGIYF